MSNFRYYILLFSIIYYGIFDGDKYESNSREYWSASAASVIVALAISILLTLITN